MKHEMSNQRWRDVGSPSMTQGQHFTNAGKRLFYWENTWLWTNVVMTSLVGLCELCDESGNEFHLLYKCHYVKWNEMNGVLRHICATFQACSLNHRTRANPQKNVPVLSLTTLKFLCINHGDQMYFSIWNHYKYLRGFVKLKKIQKSEKNSEVGGWLKPQLGLLFFSEILCFFYFCVVFCCCTCFQKIF